jgi:putative hydrolase of the HAD superfamily
LRPTSAWKIATARTATEYTRSLPAEKLEQLPLVIAELQRGVSRKRLCLYPQVRETLDQLKARYRLAVVSDAQAAFAVPELRAVGIHDYFDPIVISGDYGYRKPDRRLFQHALDRLGIRADQAIYVGNDRYRDIFGAKQLGMKTVWFCNNQNPGAEPDYIIYQFGELVRAVEFLAETQT